MKNALVSIVMPVYNTPSDLLKVSVSSVLSQSYGNIELLVVDDGSEFDFAAVIDAVADEDPRVTVFHRSNGGVSAARNFGLQAARGDYIMLVDSDDVLVDGWVSTSLRIACEYDADVVAGIVVNTTDIHVEQHHEVNPRVDVLEEPDFWRVQERFLTSVDSLGGNKAGLDAATYSKLIKASCLDGVGFPEGVAISEDQVFNHALLRAAHKYALVSTPSYYYYQNPLSVTHTFKEDALHIMMRSMEMVKQYLYDRDEIRQAFYYRVLGDAITAFQMMAFTDSHHLSFSKKLACLRSSSEDAMYREALTGIRLGKIPTLQMRLKVLLLKLHLHRLYILLKDATKLLNCKL